MSASPYNEVVLPPSMDDLWEFFHAVPQGEKCATTIRIGALSAPHRMLAKIVQHNLWPVVRRSDLILKRAQFVYAIHLRLPFCLCKHILGVILEARDESIPVFHSAACSHRLYYSQASVLLASQRWRSRIHSASRRWWSQMLSCGEMIRMTMMCPRLLLFL